MASKKNATETQAEATETPAVTLETLKAQRQALSEQIKALKATHKANGLAEEIARQEATPNKALVRTIQAAVRLRVQHGATLDDAVAGVVAMCERFAKAALDKPEADAEEEASESN